MRSEQQENQQQFDLYYQGTQEQLLALLYPLGGPHAHTFQHLKQEKVTYQPKTKQLSYTYELDNFENIDRKKQPITYTSKWVENKSNYFYSVFDQVTGTFIWRSVGGFVEMRPKAVTKKDESKNKPQVMRQAGRKQQGSSSLSPSRQQIQQAVQLTVIQSGAEQNLSEKQLLKAPITDTKPVWECSKSEYFSYLSN